MFEQHPSRSVEVSEEEISTCVSRAQAGDPQAFAEALCFLQAKLERQAVFLCGDEHQARDLLQETVLEAWRHLGRYHGRTRFFTWLCSIMVHRHYDWLRRLRTRAFTVLSGRPDADVSDHSPDPGESCAREDNARLIRACLDQLPARQRSVVYLRFYAGESLEGIATLLQCSLGTVKSRLFHALCRLAKMEKLKQFRSNL